MKKSGLSRRRMTHWSGRLRYALGDLNEGVVEGVRGLLALDPKNPKLVRELLRVPPVHDPVRRDAGARVGLRPWMAPEPAHRRNIGSSRDSSKIRRAAGMR